MTRPAILDRLRGVQRAGKGWLAFCPAHEDRNKRSLSVGVGDDERTLLNCHAKGCTPEQITASVDMTLADLRPPGRHEQHRREVATYSYTDAAGKMLYQVVRFEPKDFRCRRPDGAGGWVWNLADVRVVPYRLAELAEALRVYVPEGERDADTLAGAGLIATTNHGGAGKWREEHTRALVEAAVPEIVVLPDNDAPGQAHAKAVAEICRAAGLRVKILALPGLPPKGDVSDWLAAGHAVAELEALADMAPVVPPAEPAEADAAPIAEQAARNGHSREAVVVSAASITPETVAWLWPGRLAVGALTNMVGLPDQGKTLIYCDLAGRLTTGSPMPPEPQRPGPVPPGNVMILTNEDSISTTIVPRLIRAGADLGRVDLVQMVRNTDGQTSLLTLADDLDVLESALGAKRYNLLVVDGITGYLGDAKTHHDADVRRVLAPFAALLDRARVAGLSVMHPPKTVANLAYFAGGSVAFTAIPRVVLGVAPDPEDESTNPRRVLMKLKGNLYGPVATLGYRVVADSPADVPRLTWERDPVTVNIADVLTPPREDADERSKRQACEEWLRMYLDGGPQLATQGEASAKAEGFSGATLRRARERVVDVAKRSFDGPWVWTLRGPR